MSEESFEEMLEESLKTIRTGEVVTGKVIDVKDDEIVLNIGYKSDGIIPKHEYSNDASIDLKEAVHVGDEMEAKVVKVNDGEGQVALSYKRLAADKGNKRLEEAYNNHEVLKAKVTQVLNGGLSVVIDEARIFIPASLVSDTYERDLGKYEGQEIEFVITEFNPKRRRVIGDRKQLMVARKAEMQKELFERIKVGDRVDGTVKNVTDFGAFVDLGGADGLLHISEMSWGRVDNPKKIFHSGDPVTCLIKDINGEKIALSLKFPEENPWLTAAEKYAAGNIVTGKVARMTDFGAFVELEPGVDALLHVSQIAREHVDKPSDVLSIGQEITAKVVDFNGEDHKISLSIKALLGPNAPQPAPAAEEEDIVEEDVDEEDEELAEAILEAEFASDEGDLLKAAVAAEALDNAAEAEEEEEIYEAGVAMAEAAEEAAEEEAAAEAVIPEAVEEAIEEDIAEEVVEEAIEEEIAEEVIEEAIEEEIAEEAIEEETAEEFIEEAIAEEITAEEAEELEEAGEELAEAAEELAEAAEELAKDTEE